MQEVSPGGLCCPPTAGPRTGLLTGALVFQNQLSGNLLRKFKNSNGWQKLWVVFTNFCLFFYKSHQVSTTAPRRWPQGGGAGGRGRLTPEG